MHLKVLNQAHDFQYEHILDLRFAISVHRKYVESWAGCSFLCAVKKKTSEIQALFHMHKWTTRELQAVVLPQHKTPGHWKSLDIEEN